MTNTRIRVTDKFTGMIYVIEHYLEKKVIYLYNKGRAFKMMYISLQDLFARLNDKSNIELEFESFN